MACSYSVDVEPFGTIQVLESRRSRRLSVRVFADLTVRVASPVGVSKKDIISFIKKNADFLNNALANMKKRNVTPKITFSPDTAFHTRSHTLRMSPTATDDAVHLRVSNSEILITYPENIPPSHPQVQEMTHRAIDAALKLEARHYLPSRLESLAQQHNLSYHHLALRNMTSQWGSCSSTKRICLNIQLMRLPDNLIDMVILHELTHTIHMNHSKAFYADLDRLCNGHLKELEKEIKRYSTRY